MNMDCPKCSGPATLEVGPGRPISASLTDALIDAEEADRIEATRQCWDCGWRETRHIRVESIETTEGDAETIRRAALIDEITDELAAVDEVETLEDALAEIRRKPRLEPSTDVDEDSQSG